MINVRLLMGEAVLNAVNYLYQGNNIFLIYIELTFEVWGLHIGHRSLMPVGQRGL